MNNLTSLHPNTATAVLTNAIRESFDNVIVLGIKGGDLQFTNTTISDKMYFIGLLEQVKYLLLNRD